MQPDSTHDATYLRRGTHLYQVCATRLLTCLGSQPVVVDVTSTDRVVIRLPDVSKYAARVANTVAVPGILQPEDRQLAYGNEGKAT